MIVIYLMCVTTSCTKPAVVESTSTITGKPANTTPLIKASFKAFFTDVPFSYTITIQSDQVIELVFTRNDATTNSRSKLSSEEFSRVTQLIEQFDRSVSNQQVGSIGPDVPQRVLVRNNKEFTMGNAFYDDNEVLEEKVFIELFRYITSVMQTRVANIKL